MAPTRRNNEGLLARVNFPLYTVQMLTSHHVLVGGGGGSSKTGVANGFEIFELKYDGSKFVAEEMVRHETGPSVVMNCACYNNDKHTYLVAGQESHCQLYNVNIDVVDKPETESKPSNSGDSGELRKRQKSRRKDSSSKASDDSKGDNVDKNSNTVRDFKFYIKPSDSIQTDFSKEEPIQRVVRISRNGSLMATGGTDGHVRVWKFPSLKPVLTIEAHTKEIDDLDFSPDSKSVVTISKDGQAVVWCVKSGNRLQILSWSAPNGTKYLYKRCRYGRVEEDKTKSRLFTLSNPVARTGKQTAFLQMWEPDFGEVIKSALVNESLSALAVRDDGRFVAVGTMFTGTVFLYIAFSLQRVMTVNKVHSMFVTGLEFLPVLNNQSTITTLAEAAVISISVDNKICIHSLPYRRTLPPWLVIIFIVFTLFLTFTFCSYMGL
ncbi:guanine nucleotide-exchange factor SEC12 isoform X2 [Lycorma delicatula]|uniref:guanine nucleotide-exchange factor SEC12 isoform X2 n=1 Tax=Lycorma delicatula TaxID=130591 RepID=UPI003F517C4D